MSSLLIVLVYCCMISLKHCAPLVEHVVDLTHTFDETTLQFPTLIGYKMETSVVSESSVSPENPWIQYEHYSSSTHVGTHMDAPKDVVRDGKTIDQLDVAHFIAPAAVVDISGKAELDPDTEVDVEDLLHWESVTGQSLNGTILMLRTGWGKKWGNRVAYFGTPEEDPGKLHFPGLSGSAAQWIQSEEYASSTHAGTHMDAPRHFSKNGKSIDQLDITNFIAPAAVVDITTKAQLNPDAEATVEDLLHWESVTGQNLNGTILMLRTGWGKKWGDRAAYYGTTIPNPKSGELHYPGISARAAQWLVDNRRIVGIGIDTVSFDSGATRGYPAHKILLGHGIFALENVARMEDIPIYGAELHVMPMKIGGASGAPTRVIAVFPEVIFTSTDFCHT